MDYEIDMAKTKTEMLWDDIIRVALALKVDQYTAWQWKSRGYVPTTRHHDMAKQAEKMKIDNITIDLLHKQWKRVQMSK